MPGLHHTQQRPLSPNLFPLNARFLPSPHSHCLCAPHPPMMLGIASTSSCLCVCLSCSRYKRRAVFAAYLDTRACLPHISALPIRSIHLQFSNFAPGAVITGNGWFIKSILVAKGATSLLLIYPPRPYHHHAIIIIIIYHDQH